MQAYVITLIGQGDTDVKIVDQETYEWIVSADLGRKGNESGWQDKTCPLTVRKAVWDEMSLREQKHYGQMSNFYPDITIGSPNNDRALFVCALKDKSGKELSFWDIEAYTTYIAKHNVEILDSYEGYIY
ncbi:hypothetical protein RKD55_004662 [Rossellomorea marisflavi]